MKIAVVGSINMDMTVNAERIPLKGETLTGTDVNYLPGGKGANQAVAIARLGGNVSMFGAVGEDEAGEKLIDTLKKEGVETENILKVKGKNTGIALITVGEGDNTIIVVAGANDCVDKNYINSISHKLFEFDMVIMQHEIPQETIEYVTEICSEKGIKIMLNPAPARPLKKEIIEKLTYITPNEHEVVLIFGKDNIEKALLENPEKLIITEGGNGVRLSLKSGEIINVPARKSNVIDTTGAGDTFNAAFAFSSEGEITQAVRFANVAAGLSTEKHGAQGGMPTKEQVLENLK